MKQPPCQRKSKALIENIIIIMVIVKSEISVIQYSYGAPGLIF